MSDSQDGVTADTDALRALADVDTFALGEMLSRIRDFQESVRGQSAPLVVVDEVANFADPTAGLRDAGPGNDARDFVDDAAFDGRLLARGSKPRPRRKPEGEIVLEGINHLRSLPQSYAKKVHGGAMGNAGEPDVDACVRGRAVKLEAKAGSNKPSKIQQAALRRWEKAGALVGWFTETRHIVELLDHLDDLDYVTDLTAPGCGSSCHRGRT